MFAIDIEVCRRCGGRLRVIASIEEPAVIERILEHLARDAEPVDPAEGFELGGLQPSEPHLYHAGDTGNPPVSKANSRRATS